MNRTDAVGARLVPRSEFGGGYERRLSATLLGILLPVARISAPEGPRAAMLPASPMLVYRSGFSRKGPGCWLVLLSIAEKRLAEKRGCGPYFAGLGHDSYLPGALFRGILAMVE